VGLESIDLDKIDAAFDKLEKEKAKKTSCDVDGVEVL
jgi:hypothetical protein